MLVAYRTILVFLRDTDSAADLTETAAELAREHDAHLIGLHVIPRVQLHYGMGSAYVASYRDEFLKSLRADSEVIRKAFEDKAKDAGVQFEWRLDDGTRADIANAVTEHALVADLVIMMPVSRPDSLGAFDMLSDVALGSGRPLLIVPREYLKKKIGKVPIVAWNRSSVAARAAFGALPLLTQAESATILSVEKSGSNGDARADELALGLARHGVKSTSETVTMSGVSVTDDLFAAIDKTKADLLVMGCYGHSRMFETVFGGTSLNTLRELKIPALISH